jgi:ribosomal protein S18 acetylase RimI-like enzyme
MTVAAATAADHGAVIETLAQAFQTDPALSWIVPDEQRRMAALRGLFRSTVPADTKVGVVTRSAANESAALWRAPGQADSSLGEFLATMLPMLATFRTALPRALTVADGITAHRPKGAYWYLHYIGVRPAHQGKGFGGRLIRERTAVADAAGLPCWLETATPENVGLYQRFGFVIQNEWDVPDGGPHFWGMMRQPGA